MLLFKITYMRKRENLVTAKMTDVLLNPFRFTKYNNFKYK